MSRHENFIHNEADGRLYVRLDAVMHPLVALCDGLELALWGKGKRQPAYLLVDTAIDWCEREMQKHSRDKYVALIQAMKEVKSRHEAGLV